jgi:TonB-dependent Receptor Plug Domain
VIFICFSVFSFADDVSSATFSDIKTDSLTNNSSTVSGEIDSVEIYKVDFLHGRLSENNNINKRDFQKINYLSLQEILNEKVPSVSLNPFSLGLNDNWLINGSWNQSVRFNGRKLSSGDNSSFNLSLFPPGNIENIEIITGTNAAILSDDGTGALINFQEIVFDSKKPFVKIWLAEDVGDLISVGAVLAQNFAPNWNFNLGIRNLTSDGIYRNDRVQLWNVHGNLRRTFDKSKTLTLSYLHSNNSKEINGGINPEFSLDQDANFSISPVDAYENFTSSSLREYRNDWTVSFSDNQGFAGLTYNSQIYLSNIEYNRSLDTFQFFNESFDDLAYKSTIFGANAEVKYNLNDKLKLKSGVEFSRNSVSDNSFLGEYNSNNLAIFGLAKFEIDDELNFYGGARLFSRDGYSGLNYGAGLNIFGINLDYSLSNSSLGQIAQAVYEVENKLAKESLFSAKTKLNLFKIKLNINAYHRIFHGKYFGDYSYTKNFQYLKYNLKWSEKTSTVSGLALDMKYALPLGFDISEKDSIHIRFNQHIYTTSPGLWENDKIIWNSKINLFWSFVLGRSQGDIGLRYQILSPSSGLAFNSLTRVYHGSSYSQDWVFDYLSPYISLRLGKAFLKISYENILDSQSYFLAWHPVNEGGFRLSTNWTFSD